MKIRKNYFITLATLFFISSVSFAQFTNCKLADIEGLKQSGTVVVAISDDEATNKAAQEAMTTYWTASKFKVIKKSELEAYVKATPENYVLTYLMDNNTHVFAKFSTSTADAAKNGSYTQTIGDGLILVKNAKKIKKLKPSDGMLYCFIDSYMGVISEQAEFIRQIGEMNSIITFPNLKENQLGGWKIVTLNQKEVIANELWVSEEDLNKKGKDDAKMQAAYNPYKYKIVKKEDIAKAILEKRKGIVYLAAAEYQVGKFMFLIHNPETNSVLYGVPGSGGFDAKSFEQIKSNKVYGN